MQPGNMDMFILRHLNKWFSGLPILFLFCRTNFTEITISCINCYYSFFPERCWRWSTSWGCVQRRTGGDCEGSASKYVGKLKNQIFFGNRGDSTPMVRPLPATAGAGSVIGYRPNEWNSKTAGNVGGIVRCSIESVRKVPATIRKRHWSGSASVAVVH